MARITKGIAGSMSGKVGPVIASSWKGIQYLKSAHKPRTKKISAKEKANRQKFKAAHEWLAPLRDFVRRGFKGYSPTVEGFLAAKSYLLKNAMNADGTVDPARMKVSYGSLPLPENIAVSLTDDYQLKFTWDTKPDKGASYADQVMLLANHRDKAFPLYTINGEFREAGSAILNPYLHKGDSCDVYLAFVSEDRSRQSDSVYLGEFKL